MTIKLDDALRQDFYARAATDQAFMDEALERIAESAMFRGRISSYDASYLSPAEQAAYIKMSEACHAVRAKTEAKRASRPVEQRQTYQAPDNLED